MNVLQKALDTFGVEMQKDMAIEEMSELTKAIIKERRGKGTKEEIIEEIADVLIMMEQLRIVYGYEAVSDAMLYKLERLGKML